MYSTCSINTFSECVTPSNPEGMSYGCGIPPGEAITVEDLIKMGVTLGTTK